MSSQDALGTIGSHSASTSDRATLLERARSINDRFGMVDFLRSSLTGDYYVVQDDEVRQISTFPKAYVVEVDESNEPSLVELWSRFFRVVEATVDDNLLRAFDVEDNPYFIDVRDRRFCIVHSLAKTEATDALIRKVFESQDSFCDRAWLSSQFLLNAHIGHMRGFKFSHQPLAQGVLRKAEELPFKEEPESIPEEMAQYHVLPQENQSDQIGPFRTAEVSSQMAGRPGDESRVPVGKVRRSALYVKDSTTAQPDFDRIRRQDIFESRRSLEWLQYTAFTEKGDECTHTAYSNGKVTASGDSVVLHLLGVDHLVRRYAADIRSIENDYAIGWVEGGGGYSLKGSPLVIRFSASLEITDLVAFARSVFRSAKPFRLFGYPHSITDRRIDVEAIDLHTNSAFSVEITPEFMRIYLPIGSCGNVVARLFSNLQHAMDSSIVLVGGEGELLLVGDSDGSE